MGHSQPRALLLYFGGNSLRHGPTTLAGASGRAFIEGMLAQRQSVMLVNHRGYVGSQGRPSVAAGKEDALAVFDYVRKLPDLRALPAVVHGQSLGSVLATHVGVHRELTALVLESPPTTVRAVLHQAVPWYIRPFLRLRISPELGGEDHRVAVARLTGPVLLVVGSNDELTPPRMARELARHIPANRHLALIEGGRHGDLVQHAAFWSALGGFLAAAGIR